MSRDLTCSVVTSIPMGVVVEGLVGAHRGASVDVAVVLATHQAGAVGLAVQEVVVVDSEVQVLAAQMVDLAVQVVAEDSVTQGLVALAVDTVTQGLVALAVVDLDLVVRVDLGKAQVGLVVVSGVTQVVLVVALVTGSRVDLATSPALKMDLGSSNNFYPKYLYGYPDDWYGHFEGHNRDWPIPDQLFDPSEALMVTMLESLLWKTVWRDLIRMQQEIITSAIYRYCSFFYFVFLILQALAK